MTHWLKASVQAAFARLGYVIMRADSRPFSFELLLDYYLSKRATMFFVQIGACDGVSFDPIYHFVTRNHHKVRGLAVEPLPDCFQELSENYKRYPGVTPVHAAIHNVEREAILYRVDPARSQGLPSTAKGIASLNRDHHLLAGVSSDLIIQEKVPCVTLQSLLQKYQATEVDLLQIDTEGYDAEILLSIDFAEFRPNLIHFEHGLRDGVMDKPTFARVVDALHRAGYELAIEPYDATAYQPDSLILS